MCMKPAQCEQQSCSSITSPHLHRPVCAAETAAAGRVQPPSAQQTTFANCCKPLSAPAEAHLVVTFDYQHVALGSQGMHSITLVHRLAPIELCKVGMRRRLCSAAVKSCVPRRGDASVPARPRWRRRVPPPAQTSAWGWPPARRCANLQAMRTSNEESSSVSSPPLISRQGRLAPLKIDIN